MRLTILVGLMLLFAGPAWAHVPGWSWNMTRMDARAGNYILEVLVLPKVPEPGKLSEIVVGIKDSQTSRPYDGDVTISVRYLSDSSYVDARATKFSQGYYEITRVFDQEGEYLVRVSLESGQGKFATAELSFRVAYSQLNILLLAVIAAIIIAAVVLIRMLLGKREEASA